MGLDGLGPKLNGPEDLGKRLRRKKRARVASPQPDSRSQSNSNGAPHKATVRHCFWRDDHVSSAHYLLA